EEKIVELSQVRGAVVTESDEVNVIREAELGHQRIELFLQTTFRITRNYEVGIWILFNDAPRRADQQVVCLRGPHVTKATNQGCRRSEPQLGTQLLTIFAAIPTEIDTVVDDFAAGRIKQPLLVDGMPQTG